MQLHYHPLSTFARRVWMLLLEKQIDMEMIEVDMPARAHRSPEYLALNPYGRVPTLVDGDLVLYESTPILEYLEATHPTPAFLPSNVQDRARVAMHMKLCDIQMARQTGTIIFPKRFLPQERWDTAAMAQAAKEIERHLAILDTQLAERTYLVGEQYTLAEVCYTPFVEFLPLMEITPPEHVAQWIERLEQRPSAVQTRPSM